MAKVALVSKDKALADLVTEFLEEENHRVTTFSKYNPEVADKKPGSFDVIIIDDHEFGSVGKYSPVSSPKLIILGDLLNPSSVKKIINDGAWECISKPLKIDGKFISSTIEAVKSRLLASISAAAEVNRQEYDIKIEDLKSSGIIGGSHAIKSCMASLIPAIASDLSILIMGESGTGKELFSQVTHWKSTRKEKPLVTLNCATITETLADGILFGWEKDIHDKAKEKRDGLLIQAHGGTLFLDEMGDLSLENQTRLLRAIQEKVVTRIGASVTTPADFRVVAATNRNIHEMIKRGEFREDLYYRISDFTITIPPLRDRKDDIKPMVDHFIQTICAKHTISPKKEYTTDFFEALYVWDWPGNVRELMSEIRSAIFKVGRVQTLSVHFLSTNLCAFWMAHSMAKNFELWQAMTDEMNMGVGDPYYNPGAVRTDNDLGSDSTFSLFDDETDMTDPEKKGPDQTNPRVPIKFPLTDFPPLKNVMAKLEKGYMRQLKKFVDTKQMVAEDAHKLVGSKTKYHNKVNEYGLK